MTLTPEQKVVERIINLIRFHTGHLAIRRLLIRKFRMPGKRCTKCGRFREETEFPVNGDGYHWWCKGCHKNLRDERRKKNA